ncbi:hypothetical protein T4D_7438 [Trichinella pseudospiralis]|uniref:Uncharacterized protein n=1 Tax=Trichinella pseudospiralis TaxID=6337 RepID=A0A0V1FVA5_TRIPS|nr:hypothetical protein T4D_7438 [Trichinella pseudospiralis]
MVKQTGPMKDSQPAFSSDHLSRPMTARKLEQCNTRNRTSAATKSYGCSFVDSALQLCKATLNQDQYTLKQLHPEKSSKSSWKCIVIKRQTKKDGKNAENFTSQLCDLVWSIKL